MGTPPDVIFLAVRRQIGHYFLDEAVGGSAFDGAALFTKSMDAELMQKRRCLGGGPSSKTWPMWAEHREQRTSVRTMPSVFEMTTVGLIGLTVILGGDIWVESECVVFLCYCFF